MEDLSCVVFKVTLDQIKMKNITFKVKFELEKNLKIIFAWFKNFLYIIPTRESLYKSSMYFLTNFLPQIYISSWESQFYIDQVAPHLLCSTTFQLAVNGTRQKILKSVPMLKLKDENFIAISTIFIYKIQVLKREMLYYSNLWKIQSFWL